MMIRTLVVDDEADVRLLVRLAIEQRNEGLVVSAEAAAGDEALARLEDADPMVVVLDQMMPGLSGLETAAQILARRPGQLIVLYSAFLDEQLETEARALGITACVRKGRARDLADLVHRVARADTVAVDQVDPPRSNPSMGPGGPSRTYHSNP